MFENFKGKLIGTIDHVEIDKWLTLKGEEKYMNLLELLEPGQKNGPL